MSRNEEYYRRYEDICSLILMAYHDLYLIPTIDEIKPTHTSIGGSTLHVLSHICELAKADLALTIWKIFLTGISQHQIKAIARYTLPDILTFYESIEGPREFAEWKKR